MQTKNNTLNTSKDIRAIFELLEDLNTDVKDMKDMFSNFNHRLLEHSKEIEANKKKLADHEERLDIHDVVINRIDKRRKLTGNDFLGYLGYILAVLGIGINLIR